MRPNESGLSGAAFETGRMEILYDPDHPLAAGGAEFVIARLTLEFRAEMRRPGTVTVGTGVQRLGTSSLTLEQSIHQDDRCVAHPETVTVQVDTTSRKSRPLDSETRTRLEERRITDMG